MGRDRYHLLDPTAPQFVACTVLEWLPPFAEPANVKILLDSLRYFQRESALTLYGYVVMENHCHLLVQSPSLPKTLSSFQSFTAARIVDRLTERRSRVLLLLSFH